MALKSVRASIDRFNPDVVCSSLTPAANALSSTRRIPLASEKPLFTQVVDKIVRILTYTLLASKKTGLFIQSTNFNEDLVLKSKFVFNEPIPECLMEAVWHRLETVQVGVCF